MDNIHFDSRRAWDHLKFVDYDFQDTTHFDPLSKEFLLLTMFIAILVLITMGHSRTLTELC
jgi:hypothetical protein